MKDWSNALSVSSAMGQMAAVRSGAGIGILHDFMAAEDQALMPVLPEIVIVRSYWFAVHENLRSLPQIRAVRDFIEAEVAAFGHFMRR